MPNSDITTHRFEGSSNILRADYDALTESMRVFFRSGGIYTYVGVPRKVFVDFAQAESAGRFFVANVKNSFDYFKDA